MVVVIRKKHKQEVSSNSKGLGVCTVPAKRALPTITTFSRKTANDRPVNLDCKRLTPNVLFDTNCTVIKWQRRI